jgi:hypothetical protein
MMLIPLPRLEPTVAVGRAGDILTAALAKGRGAMRGGPRVLASPSSSGRRARAVVVDCPGCCPPRRSRSRARAGSREGADWPLRGNNPSACSGRGRGSIDAAATVSCRAAVHVSATSWRAEASPQRSEGTVLVAAIFGGGRGSNGVFFDSGRK